MALALNYLKGWLAINQNKPSRLEQSNKIYDFSPVSACLVVKVLATQAEFIPVSFLFFFISDLKEV